MDSLKNNESQTVNDILTSLANLKTDRSYTEFQYGDESYPIVENDGIKFAVLPTNTEVYKALPIGSDLIEYFKTKECPYPSFYADPETALSYMNSYYPDGGGAMYGFRTTRPTKMFILNDVNNLAELAKLFSHTAGVRGLLRKSRKEAVKELMMVTGLGTHCLVQDEYRSSVEDELDLVHDDYRLNVEMCETIEDEDLKRMSLYAIDLQFSYNMCIVLKKFGSDGYIASDIPTAFGETAPIFHSEMMFCFTTDVLEQYEIVGKPDPIKLSDFAGNY